MLPNGIDSWRLEVFRGRLPRPFDWRDRSLTPSRILGNPFSLSLRIPVFFLFLEEVYYTFLIKDRSPLTHGMGTPPKPHFTSLHCIRLLSCLRDNSWHYIQPFRHGAILQFPSCYSQFAGVHESKTLPPLFSLEVVFPLPPKVAQEGSRESRGFPPDHRGPTKRQSSGIFLSITNNTLRLLPPCVH